MATVPTSWDKPVHVRAGVSLFTRTSRQADIHKHRLLVPLIKTSGTKVFPLNRLRPIFRLPQLHDRPAAESRSSPFHYIAKLPALIPHISFL